MDRRESTRRFTGKSTRSESSVRERLLATGWIGLMFVVGSGALHAQMLPNAGSVLNRLQSRSAQPLPPKASRAFEPPLLLRSIAGPTVTVQRFRFQGNHLLSDRKLARVVSGYLRRPLTFSQLQNTAISVADAYRRAGWVVRAYLPQQNVTGGTVTIEVIEARFGVVRVKGRPARISAARLKDVVDAAQRPGKPVNADALDRALLLINDLPGVSAKGQLAEGREQGQTDLLLETINRPLLTGAVTVDDGGQRFTGATQITVAADLNSPLRIGDLAQILYLHSQGTDFESAGYDLPVGARGLQVGLDASHLSYHIVTAQFAALDARGQSTAADLHASYPLVRARLGNLYLSAAVGDRWFHNKSLGVTTSRYSIATGQISLTANRYDDLLAGGSSTVSLTFVQGLVDLGGSPNEAMDAQSVDTAGSFHKVSLSISRLQQLTQRLSLYASATGQVASRNLDSSEKLYLGGENGIRAYPTNEGGGSEGVLAHFEARVRLPAALDLTGFLDWGEVHFNRSINFPGAPTHNAEVLKGGGVALAWTAPFGLTLQVAVAHRIGRNPYPTSTGTDQDGTLIENRIWAQASVTF